MNKNSEHVIFHDKMFDFDIANATSTQDCTGLIPFAPENAEQLEAYDAIMNYSAKNANISSQAKKHTKSL